MAAYGDDDRVHFAKSWTRQKASRARKRGRFGPQPKAWILAECELPGASVSKVATSHGINTSIVLGWRKLAREGGSVVRDVQREFVPMAAAPALQTRAQDERIEVELRRSALTMKLTWPTGTAADLAEWTRELLR